MEKVIVVGALILLLVAVSLTFWAAVMVKDVEEGKQKTMGKVSVLTLIVSFLIMSAVIVPAIIHTLNI